MLCLPGCVPESLARGSLTDHFLNGDEHVKVTRILKGPGAHPVPTRWAATGAEESDDQLGVPRLI